MRLKLVLVMFIVSFVCFSEEIYPQSAFESLNDAKNEMKQVEKYFMTESQPTNFDSSSTLADYLRVATHQNPRLKSAFFQWKSDIEKTGYAGALPDPTLMFGYFIENVETRIGPQNKRISLRQQFPWFGSLRDKKNIAYHKSNMSYTKFQSEFLKVSYRVKSAYYDLYLLGKEIQITQENFELLLFWESVAQAKYKVALTQHPDIIKAQVELGKLENELLSLHDKAEPLKSRLRALLNISSTVNISLPEKISFSEAPLLQIDYIPNILENNPNVQAIKYLISKEQNEVNLASKSSKPNFNFGLDYIETGDALNSDLDGSGKDPMIISLGVSLPLWFGKNKAKKNSAIAQKVSAEHLLQDRKNQLTVMGEQLIFQHNDALRKAQLYRDGLIPKAEQSLNAVYTSYQAGKSDFLNLLDAQRELLNFQLLHDKSVVNIVKRKAEIDMLTGIIDNYNN